MKFVKTNFRNFSRIFPEFPRKIIENSNIKNLIIQDTFDLSQKNQNAINYINEKIKNPTYFVFSEDLDWARDNLIFISDVIYVDYKDKSNSSSVEEIILMSKCKNHIILL